LCVGELRSVRGRMCGRLVMKQGYSRARFAGVLRFTRQLKKAVREVRVASVRASMIARSWPTLLPLPDWRGHSRTCNKRVMQVTDKLVIIRADYEALGVADFKTA
jgi:hypothetical protein